MRRTASSSKRPPEHFPDWVDLVTVPKQSGGEVTHVLINNEAPLVYLANQGCITPHVWLSRREALRRPDRLVFDLDPPDDVFDVVRRTARHLRELLARHDLPSFVMTTGSRGVHVVVPLVPEADLDQVRDFARQLAEQLARDFPDELTVKQRKEKREGRLFLDILRNAYGQTAVPPYALRPLPGAPVATPFAWDELNDPDLTPQRYSLKNIFHRLGQKGDPCKDIRDYTATIG